MTIRRIAISLALGVLMTVAVAWIVAVTVRPAGGAWSQPSGIGDVWSYWVWRDFGTVKVVRVRAWFELQQPLKQDYLAVRRRILPSWSAVYRPPDERDEARSTYLEYARGWPLPALMSEMRQVRSDLITTPPQTRGGIVFRRATTIVGDQIVLPLRPIWSGFVLDALFFAAIAFALTFGPGMLRRASRRRRGRCEHCGYDLRGSGESNMCPECGRGARSALSAGKPAG